MKRWRRRRRVDGARGVPLTPAQVAAARAAGVRAERLISLVFIGMTASGALATAIILRVEAPEGHMWLATLSFGGAALLLACLGFAWSGKEMLASVVALVASTIGITVTVSQISAGLSLESFLFALAAMPYLIVTKELPYMRAALSAFVIGAYVVCEFVYPEGSGDAELPLDLARQVAHVDKFGAGVLLFLVVGVLELRHARLQRILEGAARYGELRATTDELTGVYNRRPVITQLGEWAQRGRGNYAIALVDLDHFKGLNDEFGHDCGDKILQAVADTLRNHFRDSDMVSRWGGDEFLVLIPGVRHADLMPILERLRRSINLIEKRCNGHVHTVSVSIGASMGALGQTPDECIAAADHALYRAKEEGRDKVVAVGVTLPTRAQGRPAQDDYERWALSNETPL
ncbi:GGDEF domain-containing protein [Demequina lutea]|uniref:Diguanylate cyclase (GGDEF)-like protein n=1 Tax=Demequina lutea TaxID=431489 RepID=A0A7Y9Z9E8_9MICO|nr:GGDEF domain-containing protein [Demequina lutea]NYI40700.1 diguanylate cyclase (GGDEF)-like protein [Demequina lutea]